MKTRIQKAPYYKITQIATTSERTAKTSILVIYTGGTLGMVYDESHHQLVPFDFEQINEKIPELSRFDFNLTVISFNELIDSANVTPRHWIQIARLVEANYEHYSGFVVIHGTDTMAYSASALSFLLDDLNKPVIFTGAQLPIGAVRTDARENLITALEIAAARRDGRPIVPEVCIYFNNKLLRGNRAKKVESSHFRAFESKNYPALATCGVRIDYDFNVIKPYQPFSTLKVYKKMEPRVGLLKLFPGINKHYLESYFSNTDIKAVVLETYGSGNAPTDTWFINTLKKAIDKGIYILNVSQCNGGRVMQGRYETSRMLEEIGVMSGGDMTTEAAVTKLMFLLANCPDVNEFRRSLTRPIRGEMS